MGMIRCSKPNRMTARIPADAGRRTAAGAVRTNPPTAPPTTHSPIITGRPAGTPLSNVRKSISCSVTATNTSRIRSTPNHSANATAAANTAPPTSPVTTPTATPGPNGTECRSPATILGRVTAYAATRAGARISSRPRVICSPTRARSANFVYSPTSAM